MKISSKLPLAFVTAIQEWKNLAAIGAARTEQPSGVSQVGEAVTRTDHATQQNLALVDEMAAGALSMKRQAADVALRAAQRSSAGRLGLKAQPGMRYCIAIASSREPSPCCR